MLRKIREEYIVRDAYRKELKRLENEIVEMGDMVSSAIKGSIDALQNNNLDKAKEIMENDKLINKKRFDIEEESLLLIATQQPVAKDLRRIAAILSIITDLERMADHAEGIAKICIMNGNQPLIKPLVQIPKMADKGLGMLDKCLKAFINHDDKAAREVCNEDDDVDELYEQIYRELLVLMIDNHKIIEGATYLTWVAHNLERIADRATNIAERVVFTVTGTMEEINVSSY